MFKPIPFEYIESFIKLVTSELPGLKLCIHLTDIEKDGESIVRVVFTPTKYMNDSHLRKLAACKRTYFLEVLKSHFMQDESSHRDDISKMADIMYRSRITFCISSHTELEDNDRSKNLIQVRQCEYDLLNAEYTKAIGGSELTLKNIPWVKMVPRSDTKGRTLYLEPLSEH